MQLSKYQPTPGINAPAGLTARSAASAPGSTTAASANDVFQKHIAAPAFAGAGDTVIHQEVEKRNPGFRKMKRALAQGVNINAEDARGRTALVKVVQEKNINLSALKFLLQNNADVHALHSTSIFDLEGKPPLYHLLTQPEPNVEAIKLLLAAGARADKNYGFNNRTALHWLMEHKEPSVEITQSMLKHGPNAYVADSLNRNAFEHHLNEHGPEHRSSASALLKAYMQNPEKVKQNLEANPQWEPTLRNGHLDWGNVKESVNQVFSGLGSLFQSTGDAAKPTAKTATPDPHKVEVPGTFPDLEEGEEDVAEQPAAAQSKAQTQSAKTEVTQATEGVQEAEAVNSPTEQQPADQAKPKKEGVFRVIGSAISSVWDHIKRFFGAIKGWFSSSDSTKKAEEPTQEQSPEATEEPQAPASK